MNSAMVAWAKKALRQARRRIDEKNLSTENRERAIGEVVKLAYYMMEASA